MRANYKRVNKIKESAKQRKRAYKISKGCFLQFVIIAEANLCIIQDIYANSFKIARVCVCVHTLISHKTCTKLCVQKQTHTYLLSPKCCFHPAEEHEAFSLQ